MSQFDAPRLAFSQNVVLCSGAYALLAGVVTIVGWSLEIPRLTDWNSDGISMFPNTALCSIASGLALIILRGVPPRRLLTLTQLLAGFVASVGALTLSQHIFGFDLGIDTLLFAPSWGQGAAAAPMRIGPPASAAFMLVGIALLLMQRDWRERGISAALGVAVIAMGTLSLTGYLYGAQQMYTIPRLTGIAMQTASVLVALGIGVVASVPDREPMRAILDPSAAGMVARRTLPIVILIALTVGGIRVWIQEHGLVGMAFGTALQTLVEMALLTALVWRAVVMVRQHEQERLATEHGRSLLAAIIESSDDAIVSKTLDGVVTSWNAGAERTFGYAASEMIGESILRVVPLDRAGDVKLILEAIGRGERINQMEVERIRKDGVRIDVSLTVSPIRDADGRIVGASKIARDVTLQKRLAQEREHAMRQLSTLYDVGQAVAAELDPEHVLQMITDAATQLSGAQFGAFFDNAIDESGEHYLLHTLSGASRAAFEPFGMPRNTALFAPTFAGTGVVRASDIRQDPRYGHNPPHRGLPEGHLPVTSYLGVPVVSRTAEVFGALFLAHASPGIFNHDTERLVVALAAQAAVSLDNARLYAAEQRARETAEDSSRAKDEFLAMLGHELRNPLFAVRNAIATMTLHPDRSGRALEIAQNSVDHLSRLVDDLLDVSRITQGRVTLRRNRISFNELVERAVETARPVFEQRAIMLETEGTRRAIEVDGDAVRLEQVVGNLLTNAAKYSDGGGRVKVILEYKEGRAVLRVRDDGIGISPELLPRVFEMFVQADQALERARGGLGIGLTVVKQLVEMHGGRVTVHSDGLDTGAEFCVQLPAWLAPKERAPDRAPRRAARTPSNVRVLLVEDNRDAADSLMMLLEALGHRVRVANDGPSALEVAAANPPDVMLVDIGLPGMSGYEVATRIRQNSALGGVVLVALTGYGLEEDRRRALAAGFEYHLVKPIDPAKLDALVAGLAPEKTNLQ